MKEDNTVMRIVGAVIATLTILLFCTFTQQSRTRIFGGQTTIRIPAGNKLVNVAWDWNAIWCVTRPMREGEKAETYTYKESSSFGFFEGTVTIIEYNRLP